MRKYLPSIIIPCVFEAVAVTLWLLRDNIFYLFNFTYIGVCIAAGLFLFAKKKPYARRFGTRP